MSFEETENNSSIVGIEIEYRFGKKDVVCSER